MTMCASPLVPRTDSERVLAAFDRAVASPRLSGSAYLQGLVGRIRCQGVSEEGRVQLAVQDKFYRDFIDDHFRVDLLCALQAELGSEVDIEWVVDEGLKAKAPVAPPPMPPPVRSVPERTRLDEKFVFDTFVSAPSNQLAYAGARAVADNPGTAFNPLFIYGGTGLGKTHLLHAIGNSLLQKDSSRRIVYVSSEEFMNEFIVSVRDHRMPEFRRKYREQCDGLLIDDIQFLGSKESTQDEFFFTFNALQMAGKPVAITSDTVPSEIPGLADRLRSRFSSGLIADIQEPDFETRVAILKKKAELLDLALPDAVAHYIARIIQKNVRELQMALNRVYAHHSLTRQPLTEEFAAHILKNVLPPSRPLDVEQIQKEVARYYKLSEADLKGPRRQKQFVRARQVAMFLARTMTSSSFPEIGDRFHRDHSTVMSSCEKVEAEMETDLQLKKEVDDLTGRLAR
ncbi:MAG: chromosomal replication initiator protein DnaA [Deltaproteobacteria bacterium]|nr:chromosomal replication initiator protein DnaA [Deltaproteobacteria bacterium]